MKQLNFLLIFFVAFMFIAVPALPAKAASGDAWVPKKYCDESTGVLSFKKAGEIVQSARNDASKFFTDPKYDDYCINTARVTSLISSAKDILDNTIKFCEQPDRYSTKMFSSLKTDEKYGELCCPLDARYGVAMTGSMVACCPTDFTLLGLIFKGEGRYECPNSPGVTVTPGRNSINAKLGNSNYFPDASDGWLCPQEACLTRDNKVLSKAQQGQVFSFVEKYKYRCIPSSDKEANLPNNQICNDGKVYDFEKFQKYSKQGEILNTCSAYPDEARSEACFKCYEPCVGEKECTIAYSEAGCFDTTPSGLITRIFQIGVGIVGGVGMVRVMQGAIMRQSGDPSKIQESYEIITSVIIGFVLLLAAVAILQFIGIRVLGILPFDAFQ